MATKTLLYQSFREQTYLREHQQQKTKHSRGKTDPQHKSKENLQKLD